MTESNNFVIMLNGPARSGKDSFFSANYDRAVRVAFADPIKGFCLAHFGVPIQKYTDKDKARVQRDIWIAIGQAGRAATDGRKWADEAVSVVRNYWDNVGDLPIIVTDCGFYNEYEIFKEAFGKDKVYLVNITRDNLEVIFDGRDSLQEEAHISIVNSGDDMHRYQRMARDTYDAIKTLANNNKLIGKSHG